MKILLYKEMLYLIVFKKIKINVDSNSGAFLGNFSELEINFFTDSKLLSKFHVEY